MGGNAQVRIPRVSMQTMDVQSNMPLVHPQSSAPHLRRQPKSPRAQEQQQQQQVEESALHRYQSIRVSPSQHVGQYVDEHRVLSPQQQRLMPPTLQEGLRRSPTKRASMDLQLECNASSPNLEEQRHLSPTRRKTIIVNPTSFDVRPQTVPLQQEVVSPRKSMLLQEQRKSMMMQPQSQPLSPRKSIMQPQSQLLSPRKSIMQPQSQPLSPRKLMMQPQGTQSLSPGKPMLPQSPALQGHAVRSFSMYQEHSTPSSRQQNLRAASKVHQRSMSISPAAHTTHFDGDDDDEEDDDDDSHARPTRMVSMAPSVHFQENQPVLMPSTSHNYTINRSTSFSPAAARQQQANQPAKVQPNLDTRMSVSPRQTHMQLQLQQPASPARLQAGINRSMSVSPTQMVMEQQPQQRLSSANLAAVQGVRPGSPPQLNRYLSTAAPRVSVVTPSRASNTFQQPQLLSPPSSKQMQFGRMSSEYGSTSSSSIRPMNHEHHLSITDVVLRSMAAIASAVAFCVMITNTVFIDGQTISYSNIAGFRFNSKIYHAKKGM